MAAKSTMMWRNPTTGASQAFIDANGIWELVYGSEFRSDVPCRVSCAKGAGNDPVGAVVTAGIRKPGLTPEAIDGATLTLPSLATTSASLPVRVFVDGIFCLTVASLPAGATIVGEVIQ
jgi:hypothetical protein